MAIKEETRRSGREQMIRQIVDTYSQNDRVLSHASAVSSLVRLAQHALDEGDVEKAKEYLNRVKETNKGLSAVTSAMYNCVQMLASYARIIGNQYDPMD